MDEKEVIQLNKKAKFHCKDCENMLCNLDENPCENCFTDTERPYYKQKPQQKRVTHGNDYGGVRSIDDW